MKYAAELCDRTATIQSNKKAYYQKLEEFNNGTEITGWLEYFAHTILDAQNYSLCLMELLIAKTKLYDALRDQLNERQEKVMARMFKEGPDGFKGGLGAEN